MDSQQLNKQQAKSFRWNTIMNVMVFFVQFVCLYFLNKWLQPEDFGQSAWALGVTSVGLVFTNFSLIKVILRQEEVGQEDLTGLFYFALAWNIILFLFFYFVIANLPIEAAQFSRSYIKAFSFPFLINAFVVIPYVRLAKQLNFSLISSIRLITKLISIIFSLYFGYKGLVFWSLFLLYAGGNVLNNIVLAFFTKVPDSFNASFKFLKKEFLTALSFNSHQLVNTIGENLDTLLVGQRYGDNLLGQYHKSYGYKSLPTLYVAQPIADVTLPIFSNLQKKKAELSDAFFNSQALTAFILLPLLGLFIALAKPFAFIYFSGNETTWDINLISELLIIFGTTALFSVFGPNFYSLFSVVSSKRKINTLIYTQRFLLILFILIFYTKGLIPLAFGILCAEFISFLLNLYFSRTYLEASHFKLILPTLLKTIFISATVAFFAITLDRQLANIMKPIPAFLLTGLLSAITYLISSYFINRNGFKLFTKMMLNK